MRLPDDQMEGCVNGKELEGGGVDGLELNFSIKWDLRPECEAVEAR